MPTPAAHTSNVTTHRGGQMMATLHFIATQWDALLHAGGSTGRAAAQSESRPPVDTHRLDLAIDITATLHRWASLVVDERGLTTAPDGTDVPAMCEFLDCHASWLSAHDIGPDAARELQTAASSLAAVVFPTGTRRVPLGPCPGALHTAHGIPAPRTGEHANGACPGTVRAVLLGDGLDADRDLTCDVNPDHHWPHTHAHALLLARAMGEDTPSLLTTAALATWLTERYGATVTPSSIRGWHHRYPHAVSPNADGLWDAIDIARWYVGWRADRAGR